MTNASRLLLAACTAAGLFFAGGCRYLKQDMANQPKNLPLSPSDFFEDGRSERPQVENTVARGSLADDALFVPKDSNAFPLPVNRELLERGQDRFEYQMLYGVRPAEQRRLAATGARVRVYLPYGSDWYGYLVRRLAERPANLLFFLRSLATRS